MHTADNRRFANIYLHDSRAPGAQVYNNIKYVLGFTFENFGDGNP